ncbi:MAG: hypothetical protein ABL930_05855, partial [Pseudobdellovibrio sp.]
MVRATYKFDETEVFKLSPKSRGECLKIYEMLLNVISKEESFNKITDTSMLDMLTYELFRLCKTREHHYIDGSYKFSKEFVKELKKNQNRQVLKEFLRQWFNISYNEFHLVFDLDFQMKISGSQALFRKEAYSVMHDKKANYLGMVPFWVIPKEKFMETFFLFRFSLICSQGELNFSREEAFELIEKIRLNVYKSRRIYSKSNLTPIEQWLDLALPILKVVGKSDPIASANKTISSNFSIAWAILFTHLDYSRLTNWRKLKKTNSFLKKFIANTLGAFSIELL